MTIPAGIPFLLRSAFLLSIPIATVYCSIRFLFPLGGIIIPGWLTAVLCITSVPTYLYLTIKLRHWQIYRDAARHGAVLPKPWDGHAIGNYDILSKFLFGLDNGFLGDNLWENIETLGTTYGMNIMWDFDTITADANIIKAVLATDFDNYAKGDFFKGFMQSVLGDGIFNADGDLWKFHRFMTRPFFTRERIHDYELFERHSEHAMTKIKERLRGGYSFDIQDLTSRFTMDAATEFLFGKCVNIMDSPLPYPHNHTMTTLSESSRPSDAETFSEAFRTMQHIVSKRGWIGWIWPIYEIFSCPTDKYLRIVDSFLYPALTAAIKRKEERKESGIINEKADDEGITLLDNLVNQTTDPVILHDEMLNILLAGRDTTASTLTFAVYFLSMYPDVVKRLRKEILQTVGPTRRPNADDIKDMKYLRAVINETLRLYPPVPINVRYTKKAAVFPNPDPYGKPLYIPANTPLTYSVFLMHQRKDYWGPDASEFDPDRFLDERLEKYLIPNPFIFLPFNAGPRICLGQQFAYTEVSYFLIKLLQSFSEITFDLNAQPPDARPPAEWANYVGPGRKAKDLICPKVALTLYVKGGVWVKMKEATEADNEDLA